MDDEPSNMEKTGPVGVNILWFGYFSQLLDVSSLSRKHLWRLFKRELSCLFKGTGRHSSWRRMVSFSGHRGWSQIEVSITCSHWGSAFSHYPCIRWAAKGARQPQPARASQLQWSSGCMWDIFPLRPGNGPGPMRTLSMCSSEMIWIGLLHLTTIGAACVEQELEARQLLTHTDL